MCTRVSFAALKENNTHLQATNRKFVTKESKQQISTYILSWSACKTMWTDLSLLTLFTLQKEIESNTKHIKGNKV